MSDSTALVLQSDFGHADGAVAAMIGVALSHDPQLRIFELSHEIEPYNIWEASYRLFQTIGYWPKKTVFVSVVDPGVGTERKSVVVETDTGCYIVTPDNGTLTHIQHFVGIKAIREIDEGRHLKASAENSYTFYGRDLYANVGAKLAAGIIDFKEVGPRLKDYLPYCLTLGEVTKTATKISGCVDILDIRFGSLWTNIPYRDFQALGVDFGEYIDITIQNGDSLVYNNRMVFAKSFAQVKVGEQMVYINSLHRVALAINQGSFAKAYSIGTGLQWQISLEVPAKV